MKSYQNKWVILGHELTNKWVILGHELTENNVRK
jgi:hypothetical protein